METLVFATVLLWGILTNQLKYATIMSYRVSRLRMRIASPRQESEVYI